jgi:hypothetical protein
VRSFVNPKVWAPPRPIQLELLRGLGLGLFLFSVLKALPPSDSSM